MPAARTRASFATGCLFVMVALSLTCCVLGQGVFKGGVGLDGGDGGPIGPKTPRGKFLLTGIASASGGSGGAGGVATGGGSAPLMASGDGMGLFPQLNCSFGEYVRNGKCTKCVSYGPTGSFETIRGIKCSKPFAVNNPTSCNFGFLSGLQIRSSKNPKKVARCIDSSATEVTLYVPVKGFRFFGVTCKRYIFESMALAGVPLLNTPGIPLYKHYEATVNGLKFDALRFKNPKGVLKKYKGKGIALNGAMVVSGGYKLCFAATAEVCA